MEMYKDRVYGIAYRATGSAQDAEDILQETFLRLWRHRQSIQTEGEVYPWLKRVALNLAIDQGKRRKREQKYTQNEMRPKAELNSSDLREKIVQLALNSLDEDKRSIFLMRVIGDYSYQEIAQQLGLSMGTVMSRLHRARKELHDHVKDLLDEQK
jgi:RNA polymerase sigma-70 factor (ECF subfamily)